MSNIFRMFATRYKTIYYYDRKSKKDLQKWIKEQ